MKRHIKKGFTLLEMMVAVAIVGILLFFAVPAYQNYTTRARVAEALEFADAARTRVEVDMESGIQPPTDLLDSGGKKVDMMTALSWNPGKPGDSLVGYILAEMDLPGIGARKVFALEKRSDGVWHCVGAAAYAGAGQALESNKLPANCREGGNSAMAKAAPPATSCPAGQVMTTAKDSTGAPRSVCGPAPAPAAAGPTSVAAPAGPAPAAAAAADIQRIPVTLSQKPSMTNNPCPPGGIWIPEDPRAISQRGMVQPDPDFSKGPVKGGCVGAGTREGDFYADVKCEVCSGPPQICEQVHATRTCKYPNNACGNIITNRLDGTKSVTRGCASYDFLRRDWYQGTSDEDKCDVIKNNQHVDFQCSFGCTKDKCNNPLRPAQDSLWHGKMDNWDYIHW